MVAPVRTISIVSLSGGQGKTTSVLFLARLIASKGLNCLVVDADPQANLTLYLGHEVREQDPTLLEVLKGEVAIEDGIYPVTDHLYLIPSDRALRGAEAWLASSGMGAIVLRARLQRLQLPLDLCLIDSPPQGSQLTMTVLGAADELLIPAEASSKGVNSALDTLQMVDQLRNLGAFQGQVLGILPFRARWVGINPTFRTRQSLEALQEVANGIFVLPPLLESEQCKKAMDLQTTPGDLGFPDLMFPLEQVLSLLQPETNV